MRIHADPDPQPCLGPPLFADIFIENLDECAPLIELLVKLADDTKGVQKIGGPSDRDKLLETLNNLVKWAELWGNDESPLQSWLLVHYGGS